MMDIRSHLQWITQSDVGRSATVHMLSDLENAIRPLRNRRYERMLDIGCGFGGLTRAISDSLGVPETHGIDLDAEALAEAQAKRIITHHLDVDQAPLPFPCDYFDLVTSFGMLDYLPFFDSVIREVHRVTRPGGYCLLSLPNLGSWHNRLFLLLGYQPRDVEVSRERLVGVHPWYRNDPAPTGHIHSLTVGAAEELMEYHGFRKVRLTGATPGGRKKNPLVRLVDVLLSSKPTLARRFFYLGVKPTTDSTSLDRVRAQSTNNIPVGAQDPSAGL